MPLLLTANGPPYGRPLAYCGRQPLGVLTCRAVPPVALDTRLAVYLALAQAAPCAVKVTDLWRANLKDVHEAVRALEAVGHGITQVQVGDSKEWGWRLDRDAWGGRPPATFPAQEALVA